MSQRGNLSKIDFPKLITWIRSQKLSGTLRVTNHDKSKFLLFEEGSITSAYSEFPEDGFRAVILRMQLLPESQQIELDLDRETDDLTFAKKIIEKGYVTEREFLEVIKQQNQDILLSLFEWRVGDFYFFIDQFPKTKSITLKIPFQWILDKGLERAAARRELDLKLPATEVFKIADEKFRHTQASGSEENEVRRFFSSFMQPSSIRDLVTESRLTEFQVVTLLARYYEQKKVETVSGINLQISEAMRKELAEAEILYAKGKLWEAWTKIRKVFKEMPGHPEIKNTYQIYAQKFKEDLQSTITSADRIPVIVKNIDENVFSKFPTESALGFLLSRIDGKATIQELGHLLNLEHEKLFVTIYLLVKTGIIRLETKHGPVPQEVAKRRQFVRAMWEKLQTQTYYEILGVPQNASELDIKTAYFRMAKQFHPDARQDDDPDDVKEKLDAIFVKVREAYQTLSDEDQRKNYDYRMEALRGQEDFDTLKMRSKAQLQFTVGMKAFQAREYRRSMEYLRSAIDLDPYEPKFYGKLAEVCTKNPKWFKVGILACKKAIQLDSSELTYKLILGTLYRLDGNWIEAEKLFKTVLQYDPENITARRELQTMGKPVPEDPTPRKETQFTPIPKPEKDKD